MSLEPLAAVETGLEAGFVHELRLDYSAAQGHARELLVAVRFLDGQGEPIQPPYPGFSQSDDFPGYRYLPTRPGAGRSSLRLSGPESAQALQVAVYPWRRTGIACDHLNVTVLGPTRSRQQQALGEAVSRFRAASGGVPPVVIRSTAPLGHGFSRPACLADAFRQLGYPVVLIGPGIVGEGQMLPASDDDGLLKLPEVYRAEFLDGLALDLSPGLFLQSSCDQDGVHVQSLFRTAGWRCVQDVHDDWEARASVGLADEHSTVFERQLYRNCDFVVAAGEMFARRAEELGGRDVRVMPNGAWAADSGALPSEPAGLLGYFGSLARQDFDWPLLCVLAGRRPELRFELHGCGQPAGEALPPNVQVIEASTVPGPRETAHWRGALLPLSPASPSAGVVPVQLAEYQARGLAVLASAQCDTAAGVTFYQDEVDAAGAMDRWLETAGGGSPERRRDVPGWQAVARRLLEAQP